MVGNHLGTVHPFWYPDPSLIVVICWLKTCVYLTLCLRKSCAWMCWDCLAFSGLSMFPREYWFDVVFKVFQVSFFG